MIAIAAVFGVVLYRMSVLATLSITTNQTGWIKDHSDIFIPITAAIINLVCIQLLNYVSIKIIVWHFYCKIKRYKQNSKSSKPQKYSKYPQYLGKSSYFYFFTVKSTCTQWNLGKAVAVYKIYEYYTTQC